MDLAALQSLLGELPGKRVACVGDLMVDRSATIRPMQFVRV